MQLDDCLRHIGEEGHADALRPYWDDSVASLPGGEIEFLQPARIRQWREYCRLDPSAEEHLLGVADRIAADPALRMLAWHCYRVLYVQTESGGLHGWPSLRQALGELSGAFYLLVALAMVPDVQETHARLGVDPAVTRDTCLEVTCFANNYHDFTEGREWGILLGQLFWLRHYPAGRLFRIGRFEHMLQPCRGGVQVWRHRVTRAVLALADEGQTYDRDGFFPYQGEVDPEGFTSVLHGADGRVEGHPVDPAGFVPRQTVTLDETDWECVLRKGDMVLDMHIPSGGAMGPDVCARSLADALAFFARTFPDRPVRGFQCVSWIYNPQLEEMLGPEANLVKHLREVYLHPCHSSGRDGLFFLFYTDDVDLATARRDTSIRRAFLDHLARGNRLRSSAMFLLAEEVAGYGSTFYRGHWPPAGLGL
jgi:hypothetical protein